MLSNLFILFLGIMPMIAHPIHRLGANIMFAIVEALRSVFAFFITSLEAL